MLNDLLQSKNAPAALILLVAGALLAVLLPGLTDFPGWAAGSIGLTIGAIAGLMVLQGRGASRDELLALRTAIKAAQRGEHAARSASASSDLGAVFSAIDDVAGEVDARRAELRESELEVERFRAELTQRDEQGLHVALELARALEELSPLLLEQMGCVDQLAASCRQTLQALESAADELDQLAVRAVSGLSALNDLALEGDDALAAVITLVASARESLSTVDTFGQDLRAWDQAARALQVSVEELFAAQRGRERRAEEAQATADQTARACEQLRLDLERGAAASEHVRSELERVQPAERDVRSAMDSFGVRLAALRTNLEAIDDLTEQMTLLALNAAIVAAQAGDSGKGFAVVADGMKDLADRAQVTDKQLAGSIDSLEEQTQFAQLAALRGATHLERGVAASADAVTLARRSLDSAQRLLSGAASDTQDPERARQGASMLDEAITRASHAAQQLAASIAQRLRDFTATGPDAEALRDGAQQLERKQHDHAVRARQLATQSETVARTLEQLAKLKRGQRRALDDAAPALDRMRELMRDHERRLTATIGIAQNVPRLGKGRGTS